MKNPWSHRNQFVQDYIPKGVSIVDFGCGNKEILDFCSPREYLGVDLVDDADIKIDLDQEFCLDKRYDLGLMLGVLEYVIDPDFTLSNVTKFANRFIILSLIAPKKVAWRQAFTEQCLEILLKKHFKNLQMYRHGRYILSTGETK